MQLKSVGCATSLFIIIALFFGLIVVKEVPLFWNLDESAHFSRAYQISEGTLFPQKLPDKNYGGAVPAAIIDLHTAVHQDLDVVIPSSVLKHQDLKHPAQQKAIADRAIDTSPPTNFDFPGSAVYSPLAYVAPSTGILTCRIAHCNLGSTVMLARIFSLLTFVGVVAFSIWLLCTKKIKWLIFVVGLLPITIFQAAAVSADGPVIALSLLFFAILIKAFSDKKLPPYLVALLVAIAICLPLIKVNYGLLDLALIPAACLLFKDRRKALLYVGGLLLVAVVVSLGWLSVARGPSKALNTLQAANNPAHSAVSVRRQGEFVLRKPLTFGQVLLTTGVQNEAYWVYSTTGEFALNSVQIPLGAAVFAYLVMVCSAFYARSELVRYKNPSLILGLVALLSAFSVFAVLYLTFSLVGASSIAGVQGRYFIPLMPFFLAAVAAVIPVKVLMTPKTAAILFSTSSSILLLSGVIYYGLATY